MSTSWVANPSVYEAHKVNFDVPIPWLVNSITTDGLRVEVLLATVTTPQAGLPPHQ